MPPLDTGFPTNPDTFDPDAKFELSEYWADLQGDDLGNEVNSIREGFEQFLNSNAYHSRWGKFNNYYYTHYMNLTQAQTPGLTTMGENGEYTFLSPNHLRSIAKTIIATMTANPPAFKCNAANTDTDSKKNTELFQIVLDYYMATRGIRDAMNKTVEAALITDAAYLQLEWDASVRVKQPGPDSFYDGDLRVTRLTNWDVAFDPVCESWDKLPYLITREWVPRHELVAKYPDFKDDIMSQKTRQETQQKDNYLKTRVRLNMGSGRKVTDQVEHIKLFHAKTSYMPEGRYACFLSDGTMVFDNPGGLPYPRIPVVRMVHDEDLGTLLGWSPLNELTAPQELYNELMSAVATNQSNTAVQAIAVSRGTDVNPRSVGKLMLLEYPSGSNPPQGLALTKTAPEVFSFIHQLEQTMQTLVGVAPASRGIAGNQTSGSAMLFQASQTSQNQSPANANYERFASEVGTLILHILQTYAKNPRTVAIMGQHNEQRATFNAEKDFVAFDRVIATLGNPLTQTDQGKLAIANQLLQYESITAQQFFEVLATGNLNVATEPLENELLFISEENDALRSGGSITPVATDNHELHVSRHRELLNNIRARGPKATPEDKAMLKAVTGHIMAHMKLESGNQSAQATVNQPGAPPKQLPPMMGGPHPQPQYPNTGEVAATNPARTQAQSIGAHLPQSPRMPGRKQQMPPAA